jgi:hypothetical protein
MKSSCVLNAAKCILIVSVVLTVSLVYVGSKDVFALPEENTADFTMGTMFRAHGLAVWDNDNTLQADLLANDGYRDVILAQGKAGAKKTGKRTAGKSASKKTDNNISLSVKAAYLMPMGDWKKLIDPGYGGMLELCYDDLFFKNFTAGIETGYLFASGKNDNVKKESIVPVLASFGYAIYITDNFGIVPKVAAGYGYFIISYKPAGASEKTKAEFEPMAKGGLSINYDLSKTIALEAGAEYGMIFEKDGKLPFALFQLGCNINF